MGGGYTYISLEDILMWMGKNCENCRLSCNCYYCRSLWDTSINHYINDFVVKKIGLTSTHSICKLKTDHYVHKCQR